MKLTTTIKAAQAGYDRLAAQVAAVEADVKERGKELTRLREELAAHKEMLNAMWKLQDKQKPGETIEFRYNETGEAQSDLVRKVCQLYLSERREVGNFLGITQDQGEPDIEFVRRIIEAAKGKDRFDEVVKIADTYIANHRN